MQEVIERLETPEERLDGVPKVTGEAHYAADVHPAGVLWAAFLPSPLPHARIARIDTARARALPGVHSVLTGADIGPRYFGNVLQDWPALAVERVRFIGERVAAVAAESREIAEEAISLIQVEYEEMAAVLDPQAALKPDAPILHPDGAKYAHVRGKRAVVPHANLQGYRLIERGEEDLQRAFAQADVVVEDVFTVARQHCGYIEPRACVVWIERDGTVRVHSAHKGPFEVQRQLAAAAGLPEETVVVDGRYVGGDFGGKGLCIQEIGCYFLARASGRPVKAVMTYAEELGATNPRPSSQCFLKTGLTSDGRIVAHESRVYYDGGAYAAGRVLAGPMLDGWTALEPYRVPNVRMETFLVYTNSVPGGQMRAPGAGHAGFIGESHMDSIARRLRMDPIELRLRNVMRDSDLTPAGDRVRKPRAAEVLETLRRELEPKDRPRGPYIGRGISLRTRHVGEGRAEVLLRVLPGGTIEAVHSVSDHGGGTGTAIQRIGAVVLGVNPSRISVRYGTTAEAPFSAGPGASRVTRIVGRATIEAATEMKRQLEELAAEVMGWPADRVRLQEDRFVVEGSPNEWAPFEAIASRVAARQPLEVSDAHDTAHEEDPEGKDFNFVGLMVEVAVDPESGQVRPTDALLVADVGAIINPLGHRGQLQGGFVFGLGNGLMEELRLDGGRVTTVSLGDYKLPNPMDVPPLRVVLVPGADGPGPFGAKSVGENVNNAVSAAIANAVYDAVGVRVRSMPVTAEQVLQAMRSAAEGGAP